MLQWLAKLFGSKNTAKPAQAGNAENTLAAASYLGRSPVLNRQLAVGGYEFQLQLPAGIDPATRDALLLDKLLHEGGSLCSGRRLTFIPLHPLSLNLPQIERLPTDNLVLQIAALEPGLPADQAAAIAARIAALRGKGHALALDCALADQTSGANYLHIDVKGGDPIWLLEQQKRCNSAYPNTPLIARNIDSLEMLDACRKLPFQHFQGSYLDQRKEWTQPRIDGGRTVILELIGGLKQEDVDFKTLARIASQDLNLYYRLLRYANSAAIGLNKKYDSLEQAMVLLGRDGLRQWLTLMLFSSKSGELDAALREAAFTRARLVESLAQGACTRAECEQAFLVGLLSLLDVLFQMPLAEALQNLALPEAVTDALLNRSGKFANYLNLAVACEKGYEGAVEELAKECGLKSEQVNDKHLSALSWALEFTDTLDELDKAGGMPG